MATIPTYQPDQVQTQALPMARQQSIASPAVFAKPDIAGALSQGLNSVGDAVARHNIELQQKEDTALSTQGEAGFLNSLTDMKTEVSKRLGTNAFGALDEYDKRYQELAKKTIESAPNERIKAYMQAVTARSQPQFRTFVASHVDSETTKAENLGLDAKIASHRNAAASDPSTAFEHIAEITEATKVKLSKQGITDPNAVNQAILEEKSAAHTGVINAMMVSNPKQALAYFGTHKDEILADQQTKYSRELKTVNEANDAISGADQVWATHGPKADGQPVQLDKMEAKVREMYDGDAGKIKATIEEIRSRASAFNSSEKEREDQQVSNIYGAIAKGATRSQVQRLPEYAQMKGHTQQIVMAMFDQKEEHAASMARSAETHQLNMLSKQQIIQQRKDAQNEKQALAEYWRHTENPATIGAMSEGDILKLMPTIGEERTTTLLNLNKQLDSKPDAIKAMVLRNNDLKVLAKDFGINAYNESDKPKFGELQYRITNAIEDEQKRTGKKLDREAEIQLMKREAARMVTVDKPWWTGGDVSKPQLLLSDEEKKQVDIPPKDRKDLVKQMQDTFGGMSDREPDKALYLPTEENIRRLYFKLNAGR